MYIEHSLEKEESLSYPPLSLGLAGYLPVPLLLTLDKFGTVGRRPVELALGPIKPTSLVTFYNHSRDEIFQGG